MDESPVRVKQRLFDQYARITRALSHPRRLEILDLLCQGTRTVEELAQALGVTVATASQHLQVLKRARLVEGERKGLYVHYSLADTSVCGFWRSLQTLGATRLAEVKQVLHDFFNARDALEPLSKDELAQRLHENRVIVVDVRPFAEYRQGHIPNAISIPLSELAERVGELPRDAEIVAYCRGPYCVSSPAAVEILQTHGYRARRLLDGLPDWKMAGFPVSQLETPSRSV